MKNLKLPFLLSLMFVFTSCGYKNYSYSKTCNQKIHVTESIGVEEAIEKIKVTALYYFSQVVKSETTIETACHVTYCKSDYLKVSFDSKKYASENPSLSSLLSFDSEKRDICVPKLKRCPSVEYDRYASFVGLDYSNVFSFMGEALEIESVSIIEDRPKNMSSLDAANYDLSVCESGGEDPEPEGCLEGFVYSETEESCVQNETTCSPSELEGIGAATGYKVYNAGLGEYGICQALTCQEGYTLGLGICNPTTPEGPAEVFGCMDNRAANFNSLATDNDMSCVCEFGTIYNPIWGCSEPN